jgi:hypothetical protein
MECVAILGRREEPADGVYDYCCYLRDALANAGVNLTLTQVRWAEIGHRASGQELLKAVDGKENAFFLLQYTALSWSRRGFALPEEFGAALVRVLTAPSYRASLRSAVAMRKRDIFPGA